MQSSKKRIKYYKKWLERKETSNKHKRKLPRSFDSKESMKETDTNPGTIFHRTKNAEAESLIIWGQFDS